MKIYKTNYDNLDATINGGSVTTQATSGVLEDLIPRVTPFEAEVGADRYIKFFVKSDEELSIIAIDILNNTSSTDDEIALFIGNDDDFESDLDKENLRIFKDFNVVDFDASSATITCDVEVSDFVKADDLVTFYKDNEKLFSSFVKTVDGDSVEFKKIKSGVDVTGLKACSTIYKESTDTLEVWIKHSIDAYAKSMEFPPCSADLNIWYD